MTCMENCEVCKARPNYICHGDFYTTGEYASLIKEFDVHGVSFNQKIDSVTSDLDTDTIRILKVLVCDSNRFDYPSSMEIMFLFDEILSKLSNDNKNSYVTGDGTDD